MFFSKNTQKYAACILNLIEYVCGALIIHEYMIMNCIFSPSPGKVLRNLKKTLVKRERSQVLLTEEYYAKNESKQELLLRI